VACPHQLPYRFTIDTPVNVTFVARASVYCALRQWPNGGTGQRRPGDGWIRRRRRCHRARVRSWAVRDELRQTIRL